MLYEVITDLASLLKHNFAISNTPMRLSMSKYLFGFLKNLKLRWKMLVVVLPLVIIPIFIVGTLIGFTATRQAYRGITQTSMDDLDHMANFTLDLLNSHYQQFQVYKQDKRKSFTEDMSVLTNFAYNLVEAQNQQYRNGSITRNNFV